MGRERRPFDSKLAEQTSGTEKTLAANFCLFGCSEATGVLLMERHDWFWWCKGCNLVVQGLQWTLMVQGVGNCGLRLWATLVIKIWEQNRNYLQHYSTCNLGSTYNGNAHDGRY